jgi:hypothetical protein
VLYHPDLNGSDVRVYGVMARYADQDGACYPRVKSIAERLAVSDMTVRRSVAALEAAGALRVEARVGPTGCTANDYFIAGDRPLTTPIDPIRQCQKASGAEGGRKSVRGGPSNESVSTPSHGCEEPPYQIREEQEEEPSLNENHATRASSRAPGGAPLIERPTKNASTEHPSFAEFYAHYPRKIARGSASKAYTKALKLASPEALAAAALAFAEHHQRAGTDRCFIPHPATWLNGQRWLDDLGGEVQPARRGPNGPKVGDTVSNLNAAIALIAGRAS